MFGPYKGQRDDAYRRRCGYEVKCTMIELIHRANRADFAAPCAANLGTTAANEVRVARELVAAQERMLRAIGQAYTAGIDIERVELDLIAPVLADSVVGDLAALIVHQAVENARDRCLELGGALPARPWDRRAPEQSPKHAVARRTPDRS